MNLIAETSSVLGWSCLGFFVALLVVIGAIAESLGKEKKELGGFIVQPVFRKKKGKSIGEIIFCLIGFTIAAVLVIGLIIIILPYILGAVGIAVVIWIIVAVVSANSKSGTKI